MGAPALSVDGWALVQFGSALLENAAESSMYIDVWFQLFEDKARSGVAGLYKGPF